MGRVLTIARREVSSLFYSPIAYVVLFLFLVFMGIFFAWWVFIPGQMTEMRRLVDLSRFALFFVVPLMTMSIFAEEYKSGRIEMLRTSPITEMHLVLGKFLGAMGFYLVLVATTLIYLLLLIIFGRPDWGQLFASYLGLILMGGMYVAIGVFFSACSREQIVAAMGSFLVLATFSLISLFTDSIPATLSLFGAKVPIRAVAIYLAVQTHIADFSKGTLETAHVAYFLGFTGLFLLMTYLLLESRKWR
jgi:ABC-2 type transport system permease protein